MNEPFCGNCGADLRETILVEVCRVNSYADVEITDGERVYGGGIDHGEDEEFLGYDCGSCGHSLPEDQAQQIRKLPTEGGYLGY